MEQPHPEIRRERELTGRVRAQMIERRLPVDQSDQLVDHERGDDRLGVDEESRKVLATRLIQPGSRRAKRRSQCDRRYQVGGGERGDRRRCLARAIGDAYDDREREQLAQPVERGESARLVARPKRIIG